MGAADLGLHEGAVPLPLTQAQHGIWLGQQTDVHSPAYLTAESVCLDGPLDAAAFVEAVRVELDRCDALFMRYRQEGESVLQSVHRPARWHVHEVDLSSEADPDAAAQAWMDDVLARPIDLAHGPLFATALLRLGPQRHRWFVMAHHIALDGFGHALVAGQVAQRYRLRSGEAGTVSLARAVDEDLRYERSDAAERDRAFWLQSLAAAAEPAALAAAAAPSRTVRRCRGAVPAARWGAWRDAAAAGGVDIGAWLLAGVSAWLHHRTGARSLRLGLPVMNRLGSVALRVPCMAMNIVPLPVEVDPSADVQALAHAVAARLRLQRPHQRYRYERLRRDLATHGGPARLFGPVVNLMPFERPLDFGPGITARSEPVSAGPVEDLSITIAPRSDTWQFDLDANPLAYTAEAVAAWRDDLLGWLDRLATAPHRPLADVMATAACCRLHGEALTEPAHDVLQALVEQARLHPARRAIEHDGHGMSYQQLLFAVQALAGHLAAQGAGEGTRVAVLLPRSPQAVTVLLAVMWVGASHVPIDPEGPPARLALVIDDARPALVVTTSRWAAGVPPGQRCLNLDDDAGYEPRLGEPRPVADDALAYVLYTSGSTGRPNGVAIGRAALAHFVAAARMRYRITAEDRVLQFAPLHFDASVEEIFLSLCSGATLVLRTDAMVESMGRFASACAQWRLTVLDLPTAFWHELAHAVGEGLALPESLRLVIIGGEAALAEPLARWRSRVRGALLLNSYGPTETTVICTTAALAGGGAVATDDGSVPIGRPLPGVDLVVVDERLQPVPPGVAGELCVIGPTLAQGYLNQPERCAERFVPLHALPGAPRAYRTGDQVVLGGDGLLRFLGRRDDELKISGHRIDPAEIETALLAVPGVREAAVVPHRATHGLQLVAFVAGEAEVPDDALRAHAAARVAAVAVPSGFVRLERLPRNLNGKVDRSRLRALAMARASAATADGQGGAEARPSTATESTVMAVWRDVLGAASLTSASDFFTLGGKSLQAIQVANRLGLALGRDVPVSLLFRHPAVEGLAAALDAPIAHAPPPAALGSELQPLLSIQPGDGPALFCVHPAEGLSWCYFGLARALPGVALCGIQAEGITGQAPENFEAMADAATARVRERQPTGPYRLLGWSSGGGLAHAIAARLQAHGETVSLLAMMDAYPSEAFAAKPAPSLADALEAVLDVIGASPRDAAGARLDADQMRHRLRAPGSTLAAYDEALVDRLIDTALHTMRLYRGVRHARFDGDVVYLRAARRAADAPEWRAWQPHVSGRLLVTDIDSTHAGMSQPAPLAHVGRVLAHHLLSDPSP